MPQLDSIIAEGVYAEIDLNATGTTELFSPETDAFIYGVYLTNGGSTAEVDLEITDGTDTVTLESNAAGGNVSYENEIVLGRSDSLQVNVRVAEGAAQTNTAVVLKAE